MRLICLNCEELIEVDIDYIENGVACDHCGKLFKVEYDDSYDEHEGEIGWFYLEDAE